MKPKLEKIDRFVCGIYSITNISNNKKYIGSTNNIHDRWMGHIRDLNSNKHHNQHLQNSWNKYSASQFSFSILQICEESQLLLKEQSYVSKYSKKDLYNIAEVGRNSPRPKTYRFIDPNGKEVTITNLKRFCEENNLNDGLMHSVYNKRRISHKGWTVNNGKQYNPRKLIECTLYHSDEGETHVTNLWQFCIDKNLTFQNLYKVVRKERLTHKGWSLA